MRRLTARDNHGHAYLPQCFEDPCNGSGCQRDCCDFLTEVCERLARYEEIGLDPEQIRQVDELYVEKCRELAEYKKLEDAGLLLKLQCKIGSKVYVDAKILPTSKMGYDEDEFPEILPATVVSYRYLGNTLFIKIAVNANWEAESFDMETGPDVYYCEYRKDFSYRASMFGKRLFLTREEAFRKLKEGKSIV